MVAMTETRRQKVSGFVHMCYIIGFGWACGALGTKWHSDCPVASRANSPLRFDISSPIWDLAAASGSISQLLVGDTYTYNYILYIAYVYLAA